MQKNINKRLFYWCLVFATFFFAQSLLAADLEQTIDAQVKIDVASQKSQQKVDKLADETNALMLEYRAILRQLDSLQTYNDQLNKLVISQQTELNLIDSQLQAIEITQRDIVPLMLKMIDVLAQFVAIDVPFLADERRARVAQLQKMMARADVTLTEKYRRILEAYQVETEYGRTIEAYRGDVTIDDNTRTVDFLRIGRVGLYYLTLDGLEAGIWNKGWQRLDSRYHQAISQALKIARKQLPPDLLVLPVSTARAVQ